MLRTRYILVLVQVVCLQSLIIAQASLYDRDTKSSELCLYGGISFYIGDLNRTGYFRYQDPAAGIGYRYNFHKRFALRLNGMFDKIHASDADNPDPVERQRNLSFRSNVEEISAQIEFNFLPFKIGSTDYFAPYIFIGLGGFHFDPQAEYEGKWYYLQSLSTEGEGTAADPGTKRYPLYSVCVPFGMGFKWSLGRYIGIGIESGMRKTATSYLDDVNGVYPNPALLSSPVAVALSNRTLNPDPNVNYTGRMRGVGTGTDWYNFTGIVISIKFPKKEPPCPGVQK